MRCSHCGRIIILKVNYCPECGRSLEPEADKGNLADNFNETEAGEQQPVVTFDTPDDTTGNAAQMSYNENEAEAEDTAYESEQRDVHISDQSENEETEIERTESNLRLKMAIIGGGCIVAVAFIILFIIMFSGSGNTRPANNTGSETVVNTASPEDKIKSERVRIDEICEKYFAGEITYSEVQNSLREYLSNEDLSDYAEQILNKIGEEEDYRTSLALAEGYFASGEYDSAITAYKSALEKKPTAEEAQEGLNNSINAYREAILDEVQTLVASENYDAALEKLSAALSVLPDDNVLTDKKTQTESDKAAYQKRLHEEKMNGIVADAEKLIKDKKWDDALDKIKAALKEYPDDEILTKELNYIKDNMPMNLTNVDIYDDREVYRSRSTVRDKNGKSYENYVRFAATNSATAKFKLNRKYTSLSLTLFIDKDAKPGKLITVTVYGDGNLIYYKSQMTENSSPEKMEINVTGIKVLEIQTRNEGTSGGGFLYFAGTSFKKK